MRALAVVAVGLLALQACSRAPADPVAALLADLEAAAEARDAERFGAGLAPGFRGMHGLDRAAAVDQLRRYFAAYESVALEVYGVEIERLEEAGELEPRLAYDPVSPLDQPRLLVERSAAIPFLPSFGVRFRF